VYYRVISSLWYLLAIGDYHPDPVFWLTPETEDLGSQLTHVRV